MESLQRPRRRQRRQGQFGEGVFLDSADRVLVCTYATFRFAIDRFGVAAFDDCLIAVDEFHHVSANPDNKLGSHLGQ
jgi:superfamily II DNA or RNA helicase